MSSFFTLNPISHIPPLLLAPSKLLCTFFYPYRSLSVNLSGSLDYFSSVDVGSPCTPSLSHQHVRVDQHFKIGNVRTRVVLDLIGMIQHQGYQTFHLCVIIQTHVQPCCK